MIEQQQATAYYSPSAGRRFFTKKGALDAETAARIYKKHPKTPFDPDTGEGYSIKFDEPERYAKMFRRLRRIIAASPSQGGE